MSFVDNKRTYVATYKEIILMFITFSFILFVLYPKDMLKNQVLKESSNYDLSMMYLQNMLKQDPSNESLMLVMAENSIKSGKRDLAYSLLKLLLNSKNTEMKKSAYLLSYKLAKEDYYFVHDESHKNKIKKDLISLFVGIIKNKYYTNETLDEFYQESLFLNLKNYSYALLKEKNSYKPNDIQLLTDAFYQAESLNKEQEAINYLHLLQLKDVDNKDKWLLNEYYYYMKKKQFAKAESLLIKNSKDSTRWLERLAQFYLAAKDYIKASDLYMQHFKTSKEYDNKKHYFLKALKSLQAGNYMKEAVELGYQYESLFFNDIAIRMFLLKLYIAAGDLKKANDLSARILTANSPKKTNNVSKNPLLKETK